MKKIAIHLPVCFALSCGLRLSVGFWRLEMGLVHVGKGGGDIGGGLVVLMSGTGGGDTGAGLVVLMSGRRGGDTGAGLVVLMSGTGGW